MASNSERDMNSPPAHWRGGAGVADGGVIGVALNPSVDCTLTIPSFTYGGMNRVMEREIRYAGKTFNTLRILSALGLEARAIGVLGRDNGEAFMASLAQSGVVCDAVWLEGETRTNIKLLDASTKLLTEVNSAGKPLPEGVLEQIEAKIRSLPFGATVLLSGKLPPGAAPDTYLRLMRAGGARFIVDTEGDALLSALEARPWLIKPNRHELEQIEGRPLPDLDGVAAAARALVERGASLVCVSLGPEGGMLVNREGAWFASAPEVPVTSTVGAGDAMVAGLIAGGALSPPEQLRLGMAAAAASVAHNRAVTQALVGRYVPEIIVKEL